MRCRKPIWLVILLALWLPLQGFAAPMMPFCQHEHERMTDMPCHDRQSDADTMPSTGCEDCSFCHLCSAPAPLPSTAIGTNRMNAGGLLPAFIESFCSHIPEHPWRPPRS
jgi:hypothetical protein